MCVPMFMDSDGANRNPIMQRSSLPTIALVSSRKPLCNVNFFLRPTCLEVSIFSASFLVPCGTGVTTIVTIKKIDEEKERERERARENALNLNC